MNFVTQSNDDVVSVRLAFNTTVFSSPSARRRFLSFYAQRIPQTLSRAAGSAATPPTKTAANFSILAFNSVLESDGQPLAKSVEMRNPFNPQTFVADKFTILDVKATDERGDIFVVEFQTSEKSSFADRMTYYGSRAFGGQMLLGHPYSSLNAVIAIAVTAFEMFPQLESVHNSFRLTVKADPKVVFTNLLQMHVLEAAAEKIGKAEKLPSVLSAWMNFFYYSHQKSEVEMTALLQEEPAVRQAYDTYLKFNSDARMRALDEAHQRFMHDQASELEAAIKKGEAKGREEGFAIGETRGKAEGKAERDYEIAKSMKRKGYSISDIAELTGLSANVIEQLR